jgi:hypothetical protein
MEVTKLLNTYKKRKARIIIDAHFVGEIPASRIDLNYDVAKTLRLTSSGS